MLCPFDAAKAELSTARTETFWSLGPTGYLVGASKKVAKMTRPARVTTRVGQRSLADVDVAQGGVSSLVGVMGSPVRHCLWKEDGAQTACGQRATRTDN